MQRLFRKDYTGEHVVTTKTYENGASILEREWIPSTVTNKDHTRHAVVMGNGKSRLDFNVAPIFYHRGGYLGQRKMETYGCNALYRNYTPDMLIVTSDIIAKEIAETDYPKNNVVFANQKNIKKYPGNFHLIPHNEYKDAGTTALRLACFDGHKKVYMIGFDGQNLPHENNNVYADTPGYNKSNEIIDFSDWEKNLLEVMTTYSDVEFIRVTYRFDYPLPTELLNYAPNFRSINYRDFVFEVDLGS